jgi:hypothetical protein
LKFLFLKILMHGLIFIFEWEKLIIGTYLPRFQQKFHVIQFQIRQRLFSFFQNFIIILAFLVFNFWVLFIVLILITRKNILIQIKIIFRIHQQSIPHFCLLKLEYLFPIFLTNHLLCLCKVFQSCINLIFLERIIHVHWLIMIERFI